MALPFPANPDSRGLPRSGVPDQGEDLPLLDVEGHSVHGLDDSPDDREVVLGGVVEDDERVSEVPVLGLLEVIVLHELGGNLLGLALLDDVAGVQQDRLVGHPLYGLGPVGGEDHADVLLPDVVDESLVDDLGCGGVEGSGGLVSQEEQGLLGELPGHDDPLLLTSRQIPGYVGRPVGHVDELEHVDGPVDAVVPLDVRGDGLHDVLDDGHVAEERECPLEHDGYVSLDGLSEGVVDLEGPEVHGEGLRLPSALAAFRSLDGEVEVAAFLAAVDVVDHASAVGSVLLAPPEHVNENTLTGGALSDETEDLPGGELGADVLEHTAPVERLGDVLDNQ